MASTSEDDAAPPRYFTLEQGFEEDFKTPRTVLCAWTPDGDHRNFGTGPSPNVDAFHAAIEERF